MNKIILNLNTVQQESNETAVSSKQFNSILLRI